MAHFVPGDGAKQALFADVSRRLVAGAPVLFADVASTPRAGSPAAAVRRVAAIELGVDETTSDMMIENMALDLHPTEGAELDALLAAAGLTPAQPFFQALGYRGWSTTREAG